MKIYQMIVSVLFFFLLVGCVSKNSSEPVEQAEAAPAQISMYDMMLAAYAAVGQPAPPTDKCAGDFFSPYTVRTNTAGVCFDKNHTVNNDTVEPSCSPCFALVVSVKDENPGDFNPIITDISLLSGNTSAQRNEKIEKLNDVLYSNGIATANLPSWISAEQYQTLLELDIPAYE